MFDTGIEDVGIAVLQQLWNDLARHSMKLVGETRDVVLEKENFLTFSKIISELSVVLQSLSVEKVEAAMGTQPANSAIQTLGNQLNRAREIIQNFKSRSCLSLFLRSHQLLSEMQDLSRQISKTLSLFQLGNLDISLNLKTKTQSIITNLGLMEFQSAVVVDTVALEMEQLMTQDHRDRENAVSLLAKIAEAVGSSADASLVQNELQLLRREKEEMESQKKQAEALQLSQLIQLLYSTEMVSPQEHDEEGIATGGFQLQYHESFRCQLCHELMADPVAILCGHSFERKAIQEHFERGEGASCPTCGQDLPSQALTPNISLRNSIAQWRQRDMDLKFQDAAAVITSGEAEACRKNKALEDLLRILMDAPNCYGEEVAQKGLVPKLVGLLKEDNLEPRVILECLHTLAECSDEHKEAIVEARGIKLLVKQIYKGEAKSEAIAVLVELSRTEYIGERIGEYKDCIPLLVSFVCNMDEDVSSKAKMVLHNLSYNIQYVVEMADAGYFRPFVTCFNQGTMETRASMAADLLRMQLNECGIGELGDKVFIQNLVDMLLSGVPAYRSASLHSIKKLIEHPKMVHKVLLEPATMPHMLGLISFSTSESDARWKREAAEILTTLLQLGASDEQSKQLEGEEEEEARYPSLEELESQHNVSLFLQTLITSSNTLTVMQFLHLLIVLSKKSETVRMLIRSDQDVITHLFSSLGEEGESWLKARMWTMQLISCISEGPSAADSVPFPSSSNAKEEAMNHLTSIFSGSSDIEERTVAGGIINRLPIEDGIIDEMLRNKAESVLKAVHRIITHSADDSFRDHREDSTAAYDAAASDSDERGLLENALGALLRYTQPSKPELQWQVGRFVPYASLVQVLSRSRCSALTKQRTATILGHLSQSTTIHILSSAYPEKYSSSMLVKLFPCCSSSAFSSSSSSSSSHDSRMTSLCAIHGGACLRRDVFCLVKENAVRPLVRTLISRYTTCTSSSPESAGGVAEAVLTALDTLLIDEQLIGSCSTYSGAAAAAAIVDSEGAVAILHVLEKGPSASAKIMALDLLLKMLENRCKIGDTLLGKLERNMVQLLHEHDEPILRKRAALVLRQMKVIPDQSSYF